MTAEPSKLPCPFCGSHDSRTLKTRLSDVLKVTRRRRECADCGGRFSTIETYASDEPPVRLRSGLLKDIFAAESTLSTVYR